MHEYNLISFTLPKYQICRYTLVHFGDIAPEIPSTLLLFLPLYFTFKPCHIGVTIHS